VHRASGASFAIACTLQNGPVGSAVNNTIAVTHAISDTNPQSMDGLVQD
jgi:hypothetical protein